MATNTPNITLSGYGSTGAVGAYYSNIFSGNQTWSTTTATYPSYTNTYQNDIVIRRDGKADLPIAKTLEMLMERLCIIEPAMDLIEKYPALKEAYENYKIVEAMVKHDMENNNEL